jgi:hypothetical protein
MFFIGIPFGPILGSLLVHFTGRPLSVFYAAGLLHFLYACMVWFIIPESLSLRQMKLLRYKYMEMVGGGRMSGIARRLTALLSPLRLLIPEVTSQVQGGSGPWKRKGRDWNLTLVAGAYGCTIMLIVCVLFIFPLVDLCDHVIHVAVQGAYSYTLQYAASMFGWTSETVCLIFQWSVFIL